MKTYTSERSDGDVTVKAKGKEKKKVVSNINHQRVIKEPHNQGKFNEFEG